MKITDNGIGIESNEIKNLFSPFFRGKNALKINGSGLGLCIVKRSVELHLGTIEVTSKLDEGSIFTATITTGI